MDKGDESNGTVVPSHQKSILYIVCACIRTRFKTKVNIPDLNY